MMSANSAVGSAMGQVYGREQAALAQTVHDFLIPMKKYQQGQQFNASPRIESSSSLNENKHTEKFTAEESKSKSIKQTSEQTVAPFELSPQIIPSKKDVGVDVINVADGINNGNQYRRDTNNPTTRKENSKKISTKVVESDLQIQKPQSKKEEQVSKIATETE